MPGNRLEWLPHAPRWDVELALHAAQAAGVAIMTCYQSKDLGSVHFKTDQSAPTDVFQLLKTMVRRVAIIITRSDTIGGASVHVMDLAKALKELSIEVLVLVGQEGPFTRELARNDIPYRALKYLVRDVHPVLDMMAALELLHVLKRIRPDLIAAHTSKAGWLSRFVARVLRVPCIFTAHGWAFTEGVPSRRRHLYRLAEKAMGLFTDKIITVSEFDRQLAIKLGVVPSHKMVTVHNGIPDIPVSLLSDPGKEPVRLVMVARFEEPKDHITLVQALHQVAGKWALELVGDGPTRSRIETLVRRLSLQDRVRFHGIRRDIPAVLAASQVFVLTTKWEGFPLSVVEAMRAGLPVVATKTGGIPEAVVDGETGFLVPREDAAALANRINLLVNSPTLRVRMGRAGRQRFERFFTIDKMLEKTFSVYVDVLSGRYASRGGLATWRQ